MRSVPLTLLLAPLLAAGPVAPVAAQAPAVSLYVAPNGNDAWSGRVAQPTPDGGDGPLASLAGARDAVRRLRAAGTGVGDTMRVVFASGTYPLTHPVLFGPDDGGSAASPVVYAAAPGAEVVISGGRELAMTKGRKGAWQASLPDVARGAWHFDALWVGGRRATRARWPNDRPAYFAGGAPDGDTTALARLPRFERRAFRVAASDFAALRLDADERWGDVTLVSYQSWDSARLQLAASGGVRADGTATLVAAADPLWPFLHWGPKQRYHLENFRAALDARGEWFLARDGALTYLPRRGERLGRDAVVAPVVERFVEVRGLPERPVAHLILRGLRFRYAQLRTDVAGHNEYQAASTIGASIEATYARHLRLDGVEIGGVGGYGVWFGRGCDDCRVERSYLHDLGAGGVRVGETMIADSAHPADVTRHAAVDNNVIRSGGRIFPSGVGVWIGQSGGNAVTHNDIGDLYYSGVSLGWTWGYGPSAAQDNLVASNYIHDIGQGMLSDLGGIYTLGRSTGTVVRGNVIRGVRSFDCYGAGGWGLYNDEGSSDILIENNLIYDVSTGAYHQNSGRGNVIRNNILVFGRAGQLRRSQAEDSTSITVTQNLIYWQGEPRFAGTWNSPLVRLERNLYWNASGAMASRMARDTTSLVADPRFANPKEGDFRLKSSLPADAVGFVPFDPSSAGVYGDAMRTLTDRLNRERYPPPVDAKGWGTCKL